MYFIEEGTVSIKILQDRGETEISKLEKGQYFGELALVTHRPRAASAYAQNNVKVACKYRFYEKSQLWHRRHEGGQRRLLELRLLFQLQSWCVINVCLFVSRAFTNNVVIDVEAFERLLGPCMDLMKRNIDDYESQLVKIFGSKTNIADIR